MIANQTKFALPLGSLFTLSGCTSIAPGSHYQCDDGYQFVANFVSDNAQIIFDNGREVELQIVRSASGSRYMSDDHLFVLHTKGDEAILIVDEISKSVCHVTR